MMTLKTCHEIGSNSEIRPCSKRQKRVLDEVKQCECELVFKSVTTLTEDILVEILIRLPAKCSCRYKAVCKFWNSLLSSSYFFRRYMNHRRHLNNSFTILFHYEVRGPAPYGLIKYLNHTEAISTHPLLSKSYRKKRVCLSFLPTIGVEGRLGEIISIKASCHDLLLCSYLETYYIVNLLTKQWIVLPSHPPCFDTPIGQRCRVYPEPKAGLLCRYNENNGWYKFKVILAPVVHKESFHEHDPEFNASCFTICIFCSVSKQWTEYVVDWYPFRLTSFLRIPMIAHNGMLHWHAGRSVVSFDPFTVDDGHPTPRLSRITNLPDELALVTPPHELALVSPLGLGVSQGLIQLVYSVWNNNGDDERMLQVWQLKEKEGVWHLAHNVLLSKSSLRKHINLIIELMAFHPFNQSIVFVRLRGTIYEFNLQSRRSERKFGVKLGKALSAPFQCDVVPPLLHQWFPTPPSKLII